MKSTLYCGEVQENRERRFGSWAGKRYYPARIVLPDGQETEALFTPSQLQVAIHRAASNPEDVPEKTLWQKLFG